MRSEIQSMTGRARHSVRAALSPRHYPHLSKEILEENWRIPEAGPPLKTPWGWPVYRNPTPTNNFFLFFGGAAATPSTPLGLDGFGISAPPKNKKEEWR